MGAAEVIVDGVLKVERRWGLCGETWTFRSVLVDLIGVVGIEVR